MSIVKEVWFWFIIVGIIVLVAGIFIIVLVSGNKTLGILILVFGFILLLIGIIYAIYKNSTKPIDVGETSRDILEPTLRKNIVKQAEQFNQKYDAAAQQFINTEYKPLLKDFAKSAGQATFLVSTV